MIKRILAIVVIVLLPCSPALAVDDIDLLILDHQVRASWRRTYILGYEEGFSDALNQRTAKMWNIMETRRLATEGKLYPVEGEPL